MKKILLVDGNSLFFRAYYGTVHSSLKSPSGKPINAVYSFIRMIHSFYESDQNDYYCLVIAFDKGKQTFRHKQMATYKGNRKKTPSELLEQLPIIKEYLRKVNIDYLELENYEADDILGCITKKALKEKYEVDILSSDKDLLQLVNQNVHVLRPSIGLSKIQLYDAKLVKEDLGVTPKQVPDFKGIAGDASDNLKGIQGIGQKGASALLTKYGTLENIYAHIDELPISQKNKFLKDYKQAQFCKEMATLVCDFKLDFQFKKIEISQQAQIKFFKEYQFDSLLKRFNLKEEFKKFHQEITIIKDWDPKFNHILNYVYLELDGSNYHQSNCIGLVISNEKGFFIINLNNKTIPRYLKKFFENKNLQKVVFDCKKIINFFHRFNVNFNGTVDDVMIMGYLINNNLGENISNHITKIVNGTLPHFDDFYGKGTKFKIPETNVLYNYLAFKVFYVETLFKDCKALLHNSNQWDLYRKIEFLSNFIWIMMESLGIKIDQNKLNEMCSQIKSKVLLLNNQIQLLANKDFNPNSSKQVKAILKPYLDTLGIKKISTNEKYLKQIKYQSELVGKILKYRKYNKLYTTYLKGLQKQIYSDGRVHTIYKSVKTTTGRLSSSNPNMQNLASKNAMQSNVKKVFIADKGYVFASFDYSQIELRILAYLTKDQSLNEAFLKNKDIHNWTAQKIFHLNPNEDVLPFLRQKAKTVNFGIIYGMTPFGLQQQLNISILDAKHLINNYFKQYNGVQIYFEKLKNLCRKQKYVETLFLRRRYIPEINSTNYHEKLQAERMAINAPIQGTAADIIKKASINVFNTIKENNLNAKFILQIHDELILQIKKDQINKIIKLVLKAMIENVTPSKLQLKVNYKIGPNLLDLK